MKKFSLLILSVLLLSCSSDDEDANPELTLRSEFANENNSNVVTSGIFAIWWDKNFEHQHQSESEYTFKLLGEIRDKSINELGMPEPPNLAAGYYLNIYIQMFS